MLPSLSVCPILLGRYVVGIVAKPEGPRKCHTPRIKTTRSTAGIYNRRAWALELLPTLVVTKHLWKEPNSVKIIETVLKYIETRSSLSITWSWIICGWLCKDPPSPPAGCSASNGWRNLSWKGTEQKCLCNANLKCSSDLRSKSPN